MGNPEAVILFFATRSLETGVWGNVFSQVSTLVSHELNNGNESPTSTRYLDDETHPRVAELKVEVEHTPTLPECKPICAKLQSLVESLKLEAPIEVIVQPGNLYAAHKTPGLAVFDMDSTLIQQEVIDELARVVGLYSEVAAITEAAMRGEKPYTDFSHSLRARVALLKGVPDSIWEKLKTEIIVFTPGARELVRALKNLGWKAAVLSGGFIPLAEWVRDTLGLDYAFANRLVSDPATKTLTGELVPEAFIVDGMKKRDLLFDLAEKNGIPTQKVIAVGDGSNDLPMMGVAGLGIAFNAKPKVQANAPTRLNSKSLFDVLYILGYTKAEIDRALSAKS